MESPAASSSVSSGRCWKVEINRKNDVFKLLSSLPIKHSEKIMRRQLAFQLKDTAKFGEDAKPKVLALRHEIKEEVRQCIQKAEIEYKSKLHRREMKP